MTLHTSPFDMISLKSRTWIHFYEEHEQQLFIGSDGIAVF